MSDQATKPLTQAVGATSSSRLQALPHSGSLRNGRISQSGGVYLVTTCTYQRQPLFGNIRAGEIVFACMQHLHESGRIESHACVLMPDHLHWLLTLRQDSLSNVMQTMKSISARKIKREANLSLPVWQDGFHDHALRSEESLIDAANYLLANPVRAGLVTCLHDYPLWRCQWEIGR